MRGTDRFYPEKTAGSQALQEVEAYLSSTEGREWFLAQARAKRITYEDELEMKDTLLNLGLKLLLTNWEQEMLNDGVELVLELDEVA